MIHIRSLLLLHTAAWGWLLLGGSSTTTTTTTWCVAALSFEIRPASTDNVATARKILIQEKMNPLSISTDTLLVASTTTTESSSNNNNNEKGMVGFGQIRKLNNQYSELASLYVNPLYRSKGIGSAIVSELLKRHDDDEEEEKEDVLSTTSGTTVCLLTLRPTIPFYEKHAFRVVEQERIPQPLQLEFAAGSLLSILLGNTLVCMVRD